MSVRNRSAIFAAVAGGLAISTQAYAGVFIAAPMTGDSDSGISPSFTYTHAYDLNGGPTTINTVVFANGGTSGGNYSSTGLNGVVNSNPNAASGQMNSLLNNFYYSSPTGAQSLTLTGLTGGQTYTTTFYNSSYGGAGGRVENITANDTATGSVLFDQNFMTVSKLLYTYTAPASGSITFNYTAQNGADGFHQYGFSNQVGNANLVAIPNLYNTGVTGANNADGTNTSGLVGGGGVDNHFTVQGPGGGGFVATKGVTDQGAWSGVTSNSLFINDQGSGQANEPFGSYDYRTTFSLAGFNPATAILNFQLDSDDQVTDVLINGVSTGITWAGFSQLSPEEMISSGFVAGTNTLDFIVLNGGNAANPTGFNLDNFHGVAMVPEPASLTIAGLGALALLARRRNS